MAIFETELRTDQEQVKRQGAKRKWQSRTKCAIIREPRAWFFTFAFSTLCFAF
jgi:hypothetical protein